MRLEQTTRAEQKLAQSSVGKAEAISAAKAKRGSVKLTLQEEGDVLEVPAKAFSLFVGILKNMAEGKGVALLPSDASLSTQQAADLLNVSRPHLVKLLEAGDIAFTKTGTHRRLATKDVLAYAEKQGNVRRKNLDFLAKQAQELNLGYR